MRRGKMHSLRDDTDPCSLSLDTCLEVDKSVSSRHPAAAPRCSIQDVSKFTIYLKKNNELLPVKLSFMHLALYCVQQNKVKRG